MTNKPTVVYRKHAGSNVWHFCDDCSTWPSHDYIESFGPEITPQQGFCVECGTRKKPEPPECN